MAIQKNICNQQAKHQDKKKPLNVWLKVMKAQDRLKQHDMAVR
ncbi:hypothetical protein COLO4_24914 [Corchorus olitorius]|uniref:Uncharacterized protein n=1 Tax=Corchorus olitorius TaxID=93759 RepID=A0A1R3I5S9_9ROSI|nr:hypothetical protein COLO4_24914 [Corchorus olitorius]